MLTVCSEYEVLVNMRRTYVDTVESMRWTFVDCL